jgi:hypothetical protein
MPLEKAFEILDKDTGPAFDADCVAGLKELYGKEEIIHTVKAA